MLVRGQTTTGHGILCTPHVVAVAGQEASVTGAARVIPKVDENKMTYVVFKIFYRAQLCFSAGYVLF